jgi:hypothetical protein
MAGQTQNALYAEIDLELSWSEEQLPQVLRTKHVHALHPYLGKYVPQLVETFLHRYFEPGDRIYDPFVGSGTTLVESKAFGAHAVGCDISAFNCLLSRVKTARYSIASLEMSLRVGLEEARHPSAVDASQATPWLQEWFSPRALGELIAYRDATAVMDDMARDAARIILTRSARSARLTTHFDLDLPRAPTRDEYYCHKHKRTCRPVDEAAKFLRRYTVDTIRRLRAFADVRTSAAVDVLHEDARFVRLPEKVTGVITSPPYPGLIDYHEQHRYAYELLGLDDRRQDELGAAGKGSSRKARDEYSDGMAAVLASAREQTAGNGPFVIVVNDSRGLYPDILSRSGLRLVDRSTRHVNRRTGRRAGEYYEDVLICAPDG